jgi:hypothetical protein
MLQVTLGTWQAPKLFWILDMSMDVVLGLDFLERFDPHIGWKDRIVTLRDAQGHSHQVEGVSERELASGGEALNLLSKKEVRRCLRDEKTEYAVFWMAQASNSPPRMNKRVKQLLDRYQDVFPDELPKQLPPERAFNHSIDTGDTAPVNLSAYSLSQEKLTELRRQVTELADKGLIQVSSSPWGFPVIFVKKPGGEWRMCIDYRALNEITKKNGYPLPRIQELIDLVGRAKYLTKIDLASGYWQVRVAQDSIPKTAFNTIWGKFEWKAMPFGLCNAPATFQTMMNETLRGLLGECVLVYLDDILVFSDNLDKHLEDLEQVLQRLRSQKLYAKPKKCIFATKELEFCGHIIGNGKVEAVPAKLDVIKTWPRPKDVHGLRQFLGLCTYYRRFVKGFANIAAPLHEMLKESDADLRQKKFRPITWTEQSEHAFRKLKSLLVDAPVLMQPRREEPYIIETDASEWAIGYVLSQLGEDGKPHPVAYDGRKLTGAELNYPVHEKELLAIKEALRTWHNYIENGTKTLVLTDHQGLQYLQSTRQYSKRLARWVEEFQDHSLDVRYRKGEEAVVPDAISRRPDFVKDTPANVAEVVGRLSLMTSVGGFDEAEWHAATVQYLLAGTLPKNGKLRAQVERHAGKLTTEHLPLPTRATQEENTRLLYKHGDGTVAPYLEPPFREDFLRQMHEGYGHLSFPGLRGVIRNRAWWPALRQDIEEIVRTCPNCQVSRSKNASLERESAQYLASTGIRPFQRWGLDLIGLLPTTPNGNRWIVTAIDYATGWPLARALVDATEENIADFLHEDLFTNYGAPQELLTDNGTNLLAKSVEFYLVKLKTRHRTTTPYHPRTNGKVENLNGLLGAMLTKYCMGLPTRVWDLYLHQALAAARFREHTVTKRSPFYLVYGVHPRLVGDKEPGAISEEGVAALESRISALNHARSLANEALLYKAIRAKLIRDSTVSKSSLEVNSWVLMRNEAKQKFESQWFGPYKVLKKHPLGTYALAEPGGRVLKNLVNGARLVPAHVNNPGQLWTSSAGKHELRRADWQISHPDEAPAGDDDEQPLTYNDLSTISRKEWDRLERSGVRSRVGGEGDSVDKVMVDRILAKARSQQGVVRRREKRQRGHEAAETASQVAEQGVENTPLALGEAGPNSPTYEDASHEVDEGIEHLQDSDDEQAVGQMGLGDQASEDAPQVLDESPYLLRRPRRGQADYRSSVLPNATK